jgi:hypothetical protein
MTSLTLSMFILFLPQAVQAAYYHPAFDPAKGGSVCYYRVYSDAFLKKNPNVKLKTISVERRKSLSDAEANSVKKFALTFGATTKSEDYTALAECKPQGSSITCNIEADGGTFILNRTGNGLIIKTRRIEIEGVLKDLAIVSGTGKPTRSFTLRGAKKQTCAAVFD